MRAILWLINTVIEIYVWLLIAQAILSWLLAFGVINRHNRGVAVVSDFLADTELFDARPQHLVLAHLSEQNNTPDIARICAEEALGRRPGEFAFHGTLHVASQRVPLGPFDL